MPRKRRRFKKSRVFKQQAPASSPSGGSSTDQSQQSAPSQPSEDTSS